MRRFLVIPVLLLSVSFLCGAQSISDCTRATVVADSDRAFDAGERLEYVIQYRWLGIRSDVGNARMTVSKSAPVDGRPVFFAQASGETARFFDSFFKVRDVYKSRFFVDNGRPVWFHRDIYEGGYSLTNDFWWDTRTDEINAHVHYISSNHGKDTVLAGKVCTYDFISMFYAARNIDYSNVIPGRNYPLSFVIDDEIYDIYFRFEGYEEKKVPRIGTFRTMKFALKVIAGEVFDGKNEIMLWITADRNKIPVWIESPIIVGSVVGRLSGYENLKHPLTSKTD